MTRYNWRVTAASPLHLSPERDLGGRDATMPYIPGSAVRGAVLAAYLRTGRADDGPFDRLATACRFGNLYPVTAPGPSAPLPLSAVTCQRAPGFLPDGGHGGGDLLVPAEALRLLKVKGTGGPADAEPAVEADADWERALSCPRCSSARSGRMGSVVPWRGFVQWQDDRPSLAPVAYGTAFERRSRMSAAGVSALTLRQTLRAGQQFAGTVTVGEEKDAQLLADTLDREDQRLWVGAARSRGLGELRVEQPQLAEKEDDLAARCAGLQSALTAACARLGATVPDSGEYVTITLQSPALLADGFGRWRVGLDDDTLSELFGLPPGVCRVRDTFADDMPLDGWNAALGLPKIDAVALAGGSCWLVRLDGTTLAEAMPAFRRVEEEGIGERREEGFGAVRICAPDHWRLQELEQERRA